MDYVIVCQGLAGYTLDGSSGKSPVGQFLASYDPEAHGGQGFATWTRNINDALLFTTAIEANRCWTAVPKAMPLRADGHPNRPLTAFNVMIAPVTDYTEDSE